MRRGLLRFLFLLAGGTLLAGGSVPARAGLRVTVAESGPDRLRLVVDVSGAELAAVASDDGPYQRVRLPGFLDGGEPGLPTLPTAGRWMVLPPDGEPRLQARVVARQRLGSARLVPIPTPRRTHTTEYGTPTLLEVFEEAPGYAAFRSSESDVVRLGAPVWMRRQRMASLTLDPVLYDAASGEVVLATRIEITVAFPAAGKALSPEPGPVDEVVLRSVLNPSMAASWRTLAPGHQVHRSTWQSSAAERAVGPHRLSAKVSGVQPLDPAALHGDPVRLRVDRTGLTRVKLSDLIADHGFPTDVPRRFVRLYQMRYNDADPQRPLTADVPFTFVGNPDPDGLVAAGDAIVFYAFSPEDDAGARSVDGDTFPAAMDRRPDNFNTFNVYWCAAADPGAEQWARMPVLTMPASQGSPRGWFHRIETFEGDAGYQQNPLSIQEPRYHWNRIDDKEVVRAVEVKHPRAGGDIAVTWTVVRLAKLSAGQFVHLVFTLRDRDSGATFDLGTLDVGSSAYRVLHPESTTIAADLVGDGFIELRMVNEINGINVSSALGSIQLEYDALYEAETGANQAFFDTGQEGGDVDLEVGGFTTANLLAFEVTDPRHPGAITLDAANVLARDGERVLSLHVTQPAGEKRAFAALPVARIPSVASEQMERDEIVDVIEATGPAKALAIGPALFQDGIQPWLNWRRDHDLFGWDYAFVDVQQIYDQFSGGLKAPRGIKRFTEYAYTMWDARALLLVGDANENAREIGDDAVPDHVPPSLHIQTYDDNELLVSDKWYGLFCTDSEGNVLECTGYPQNLVKGPDMLVGRLPANDVAELRSMVDKIIAYEQPSADEPWRQRTLWACDDDWSTAYLGSACYTERSEERGFVDGQTENALAVSASLDSTVQGVLWDLDENIDPSWREPVICNGDTSAANRTAVQQRVANVLLPRFRDVLSQGWLMVSYQGHAAFSVLTHESLFQRDTVTSVRNTGRPFVFFGMGCHISDFVQEGESVKGKAIGELFVTMPAAGAIASYGSSGFEFLTPNRNFMHLITDNFFTRLEDDTGSITTPGVPPRPPITSDPLRSVWILGEQLAQSEMEILGTTTSSRQLMMAQYNLLGDPLLRMDAGPPRLALEADGESVTDGGQLLPSAGSHEVSFGVRAIDHSGVDRIEVFDDKGRDYGDRLQYAGSGDQRDRQASLVLPIYPQGYVVQFQTFDGSYPEVRPTTVRLTVPFTLAVRVDRDGDGTPEEVVENEGGLPIGARAAAELEFTSPIALVENDIVVTLEGARVSSPTLTALTGDGRSWLAEVQIEEVEDAGRQVFHLTLQGVDTPFTLRDANGGGSDVLALTSHFPFPNPTRGPVHFVAETTRAVDEVRLTVYDLTGRPVQHLTARQGDPALALSAGGESKFSLAWDGRDGRGDELANGVYLYRLEARGSDGQSARSSMGRLVFMR